LLEAYFSAEVLGFELSLIAVHFPQKKAQIPLFEALKNDSESLLKTEFSWVSPRTGNRFRYDQVLASPAFNQRVIAARYDHAPREAKYSDHSLMIVDL